jgi:aspartate/methionine/tyrosine aminotransferase
VIAAAEGALAAGYTHYTDRPGILKLRQWVADHLKQTAGISLTPNDVTITCGATEARFVVIKRLLKAGQVIVSPGSAAVITGAAHLCGLTVSDTAQDDAALLYLTPNDPRDLLPLALQRGWWVIWDVSGDPDTAFHPAQEAALAPKVITVGSLSAALPGWRVGWMAGSSMAEKLRAYKQSMTICTTSISQWAALGVVEK